MNCKISFSIHVPQLNSIDGVNYKFDRQQQTTFNIHMYHVASIITE